MIRPSSATQPTRSSRSFHTRPSVPPGDSTRATSGAARTGSTQCQACANSTASTDPSGSGICSAVPASAGVPGSTRVSSARMPSDGSTATTSRPRATSWRVSFPVPAPRSRTRRAVGGSSQSSAPGGKGGRPRSYRAAAGPKEAARAVREGRSFISLVPVSPVTMNGPDIASEPSCRRGSRPGAGPSGSAAASAVAGHRPASCPGTAPVPVRARRCSSLTGMASPVTNCMQLNHIVMETSHGPRSPGSPWRVVRCGIRCSNSLSDSIVKATSAWDNRAGRGSWSAMPA